MILRGPKKKIELQIVSGPDNENWCKVEIRLDYDEGVWTSPVDPCLRGHEVIELAQWLRSVANGQPDTLELHFLEPELAFGFISDSEPIVRISLRYSMSPPQIRDSSDEFHFDIPAERNQLERASDDLMNYIQAKSV